MPAHESIIRSETTQQGAGDWENLAEKTERERREKHREVGARVLAAAGFEQRQTKEDGSNIVASSYQKALDRGEKLKGKPQERRVDAYISRIDAMIEEYGSEVERKLWDMSAHQESLLTRAEDLPETYWKNQEQILRDNGQGRVISDYEKGLIVEDIRQHQLESLEAWSSYFGDKDCPYPTWFKVYAWDGMTKMATFDKEKKAFRKRNKTTVGPYPHFDAGTLSKVYDAVANHYGLTQEKTHSSDPEADKKLEALVKSGNFNKLYSMMMLDKKVILKTPERTEDVVGEWREYNPGDEEELAKAADGTPWCVASPAVGKNYLSKGSYGTSEIEDNTESKAQFILFHLQDPETGQTADNACASIRLNTEGEVAEISGLNDGQALEDPLVEIVEEKVKTLPGGEEFLEKFADKRELIRIDKKMQAGEELTDEELEFIYEAKREIKTLDTYNSEDPRIREVKKKYPLRVVSERGLVDPRYLFMDDKVEPEELVGNIDYFVNTVGIEAQALANYAHGRTLRLCIPEFLEVGYPVETVMEGINKQDQLENFTELTEYGAELNLDELLDDSRKISITNKVLDQLLKQGYTPDELITVCKEKSGVGYFVEYLIEKGADPQKIADNLYSSDYVAHMEILEQHGIEIDCDELLSKAPGYSVVGNLGKFIKKGYSLEQIVNRNAVRIIESGADNRQIYKNLTRAGITYQEIARNFPSEVYIAYIEEMMKVGVKLESDKDDSSKYDRIENYINDAEARGENRNEILGEIGAYSIFEDLEFYKSIGLDVRDLYERTDPNTRLRFMEQFRSEGITVDVYEIAAELTELGDFIVEYEKLLEHGFDPKRTAEFMPTKEQFGKMVEAYQQENPEMSEEEFHEMLVEELRDDIPDEMIKNGMRHLIEYGMDFESLESRGVTKEEFLANGGQL